MQRDAVRPWSRASRRGGAFSFTAAAGCACPADSRDARVPDPTCTAREIFVMPAVAAATVLFVIDDSGSMCEEQGALRDDVGAFLDGLRSLAPGARYHVGVTTTDTSSSAVAGRLENDPVSITATASCPSPPPPLDCTTGFPQPLPKWVDESSADPIPLLRCLAQRGITGFGGATPLGAARMALSPALLADPLANGGFYVPGSVVAIVFFTDEEDCSVCSGTTCSALPGLFSNDCEPERVDELTPVADFVAFSTPATTASAARWARTASSSPPSSGSTRPAKAPPRPRRAAPSTRSA